VASPEGDPHSLLKDEREAEVATIDNAATPWIG